MTHCSFHLQYFIPFFSVDSRNNILRQQNENSVSQWVNLKFKLSDFWGFLFSEMFPLILDGKMFNVPLETEHFFPQKKYFREIVFLF